MWSSPSVGLSRRDTRKSFGSWRFGGHRSSVGFLPFRFLDTPLSQLSIFAHNQPEWRGAIRLTYNEEKEALFAFSLSHKTINTLSSSNALIRKLCDHQALMNHRESAMMSFSYVSCQECICCPGRCMCASNVFLFCYYYYSITILQLNIV